MSLTSLWIPGVCPGPRIPEHSAHCEGPNGCRLFAVDNTVGPSYSRTWERNEISGTYAAFIRRERIGAQQHRAFAQPCLSQRTNYHRITPLLKMLAFIANSNLPFFFMPPGRAFVTPISRCVRDNGRPGHVGCNSIRGRGALFSLKRRNA